jgi:hypothetical protein
MARNVRVVFHNRAVDELLRLDSVRDDLRRRADAIATVAGAGYEVQQWRGRRRWRVTVRTATYRARVNEARTHRLVGALGAGRR